MKGQQLEPYEKAKMSVKVSTWTVIKASVTVTMV